MAVTIDVDYLGDLHCTATHGPSGSELNTDAPADNGGTGELFSPTDLVATGFGACIVTTMGILARRVGLDLTGTSVHVEKHMTADPVRRIGALVAVVTFAHAFSANDRMRLERSARTCPVHQSLHPEVKVEMRFEYPAETGV